VHRHLAALPLLAWSLACGEAASTAPGARASPGEGLLFIGNSLTMSNDLPGLVSALAQSAGGRLPTSAVAFPGFALEDHWTEGTALREIDRGGWSVVVLQQGPSGLPDSRVNLRQWTAAFDERIRKAGAHTALFSVWPAKTGPASFEDVAGSYSAAAADVGGIYLPVTHAWLEAWRRDPALALYSGDDFHPSPEGSYLAAVAICGLLAGASPVGLPASIHTKAGTTVAISPATAQLLQEAAAAADARFGRSAALLRESTWAP